MTFMTSMPSMLLKWVKTLTRTLYLGKKRDFPKIPLRVRVEQRLLMQSGDGPVAHRNTFAPALETIGAILRESH